MLCAKEDTTIPPLTQQAAHAAFPNSTTIMQLRDAFGPIFHDADFASMYPTLGQPAESPARLALVTILQFVENLTDRQAADAVRSRIDWKYALGLDLGDPGFHYSVLSEFRTRLIAGGQERLLLDRLLTCCAAQGLLQGTSRQRTDSTHVLAAVRAVSLLELVGETMRRTLEEIARCAPDWLHQHLDPAWIERYGWRFELYRLPKRVAEQQTLAETIGRDGRTLLDRIAAAETPADIKDLPIVATLRRIWWQQFYCDGAAVHWRVKKQWGQPPSNHMVVSPDDVDARYCIKRSTVWTGYKVHLTETCAPDHPHLITQVMTTPATTHDVKCTAAIQDDLLAQNLGPATHLVDEGYMELDLLMTSQQRGIDLVGPVPSHKSWQSRTEGAFDHTQFQIDWETQQATCPAGKTSVRSVARKTTRGTPNVQFAFSLDDCGACALRDYCTRAKDVGRTLTVYPQTEYAAQEAARQRQTTADYKALYAQRAGIEGTISQGVRAVGMRQSRYCGLARTRLQHVATAAALNVIRATAWLMGARPEPTRKSPLRALVT